MSAAAALIINKQEEHDFMPKKIEKNIINPVNQENLPKKRGRPKGSTNVKRPDKTANPDPGENTKFLAHDIKLYRLPKIHDMNDIIAVQDRINLYLDICRDDDIKPSVASLALAFGVSRFVLFDWLNSRNGTIKNENVIHALKAVYDLINSYYEHMMNTGKINPVAGIFLMKNNMGYKDTTDYVIQAKQETDDNISDITSRAGLLE